MRLQKKEKIGALLGGSLFNHRFFSEQAIEYGYASRSELEALAEGWRGWAANPRWLFSVHQWRSRSSGLEAR